ncbi:MAG: bifunctional DNA-formamidopyrimidine glycosylase/DNA-(apurinic or apyrimidinic site) lyase [Gammaproteobacteria bacterium]|nr:bifunctional DNA-formamidopyrimidine glycosylase/DNA-(apurinic or apyrimidinic site) lyase [Gammaproteobacteria bacterium]MDE0286722.1 bifunctional DNA-formamidopyrimidine glycosylase/DNA-(apurinic or apyrimidinic site) lyase [Gammaproteobacteria bacterium]MDE0511347.1 bifunctional DNA-formamidopyrimidine glycosylase/DNA-(apurinic or apyrimidinic site) lyase [Gammaproteobacteria bacterium]
MPELPEVETTRRGIAPHVINKKVRAVVIRQQCLRWPIPAALATALAGRHITRVGRRAKYLIFYLEHGSVLLHLGMSGSLRVMEAAIPPDKHDHVDIVFHDHTCLRLRDPRRFGSIHWTEQDPLQHPLLRHLGPEPLGATFTGERLYALSRGRTQSVKIFIMDSRIVVGVGNIYASEALFRSGIHPLRRAGNISLKRYGALTGAIRDVLNAALAKGGTTLRDFVGGDGAPGYFKLDLNVYDRAGEPCRVCAGNIRQIRQGQRSTYYCPRCQR